MDPGQTRRKFPGYTTDALVKEAERLGPKSGLGASMREEAVARDEMKAATDDAIAIPKFLRRLAAPDKPAHNPVMTPDRLRWCLDRIRWSQRQLGRELGIGEATVRKWARGALGIPPEVGPWLEALAAVHAAMPRPAGWKGGGAKNA